MHRFPVIDLHEDLWLAEDDEKYGVRNQTNLELLAASPVKVVLGTGFADLEHPHSHGAAANAWLAKDLARYQELCATDPRWKLIKTAADLQEIFIAPETKGILFHIEGLNAITSEADFAELEEWYAQGLRSIGMVWNHANSFGGGAWNASPALSPLGSKLIAWCEARGVIVDLAHMNRATFWDALPQLSKPPLVTHTGVAALVDDERNLDDEQLRAVAERGGVAGVFFSRKFTAPHKERHAFALDDVLAHLAHMKDVMGADHIAFGTDYGGALSGTPADAPAITDLSRVIETLSKEGWKDEELEKLCSGNALRVLSMHLQ